VICVGLLFSLEKKAAFPNQSYAVAVGPERPYGFRGDFAASP
jgi:hypothetical protein